MAYAIFRTAKYKTNYKIGGLIGHHLREKPEKIKGLDPSRSHLNITIGAPDRAALFKAVRDRIATCTRKARPDANRVVELVATASPVFFADKSHDHQKAYLLECVDFAKQKFGAANVVGAYLHFDEKTPHVHIVCVPLETSIRTTKKMTREITALNAGHFFGGKEKMIALQDEFAAFVQARGHDLKRGEPKSETGRDHVPVAQHWKEKRKEIDAEKFASAELFAQATLDVERASVLRRDAETATRHERREVIQRQAAAMKLEKEAQSLLVSLEAQRNSFLPLSQLSELVQRPELVGMLDFIAKDDTARQLLGVLKNDPNMSSVFRNSIDTVASFEAQPADWTPREQLKAALIEPPTPF